MLDPQSARPVPHGVVAERADEPVGGRGSGDAREGPGVDANTRHLLLQRVQVAVIHEAENVQQAQQGERLGQVTEGTTAVRFGFRLRLTVKWEQQRQQQGNLRESSEVDVIAAAQRQVMQILQLCKDREAVSHQQSAVTATQEPDT